MPVAGGEGPTRVVDAPTESAGGAWTGDGRIVFAPLGNSGLMAVPPTGGSATAMTELNAADGELEHGWPHALPDGSIVFTVSQRGRDPHLEVLSPKSSGRDCACPIIGQAQFMATGHLVYSFLGNLMAVRFDLDERHDRRRARGHGEGHSDVDRIRRARAIGVRGFANRHARVAARRRR